MQLSPMNTTDVTLKTQNEIGGCRTQQICHGMSNMKSDFHSEMYITKSLLGIVSTEIKKIKNIESYLENVGAERFERLSILRILRKPLEEILLCVITTRTVQCKIKRRNIHFYPKQYFISKFKNTRFI